MKLKLIAVFAMVCISVSGCALKDESRINNLDVLTGTIEKSREPRAGNDDVESGPRLKQKSGPDTLRSDNKSTKETWTAGKDEKNQNEEEPEVGKTVERSENTRPFNKKQVKNRNASKFPSGGKTGEPEKKRADNAKDLNRDGKSEKAGANAFLKSLSNARAGKDKNKAVKVELAFDNADIYEVLDATLYELYNINYIVDPHLKAKVSFHFSGEYTESEFITLLNEIFQMNNISIVKGPGSMYKIVRKSQSPTYGNISITENMEDEHAGDIARLIRLRYVSAATAAKSISHFTSKGASVTVDNLNNTIIVTDTKQNIDKIVNVLSLMDVPFFKNVAWRLFELEYAEAKDVYRDLMRILKSNGLYKRAGMDNGAFTIVPLNSINSIMFVTRWESLLNDVERWVNLIDSPEESGGGTGVFVYFVENGTASELADILKQLYGGKRKKDSNRVKIVDSGQEDNGSDQDEKQEENTPEEASSMVTGDLTGEIEIIPDDTNNAIVFKASGRDYKIIEKVLKKLDIVPRQVLINAIIAEVSHTDKSSLGVQWLLDGKLGDYTTQMGYDNNQSRALDTALGSATSFTFGVYNSADFLRGLVQALDADSNVNILSSPNILAVDNKEAFIEVGEEIPTKTGSVTDSDGGVTNTIQYRNTGIILKVTPHINSSGLVKMDLNQEVSDIGQLYQELENYSILNRKAETSLVVNDGQTILLGGLMRSNENLNNTGVPLLKDIPVLGYLFSGTENEVTKRELIFLITPHVIDSRSDADKITREFTKKIDAVKDLIDKQDF